MGQLSVRIKVSIKKAIADVCLKCRGAFFLAHAEHEFAIKISL